MSTQKKKLKRPLAIILAATVTSGALATVITDQVISRRATIQTDDGATYEVELLDTPEGATGKFVADDGTEYHLKVGAQLPDEHTVDVDGPAGGSASIDAEDHSWMPKAEPSDGDGDQNASDP